MTEFDKKLNEIFYKHEVTLKGEIHNLPYAQDIQNDIHDAMLDILDFEGAKERYILSEDYIRDCRETRRETGCDMGTAHDRVIDYWEECWFDDNQCDVADIVVPMLEGIPKKAYLEYFRTDTVHGEIKDTPKRRATEVLYECADLMQKKGAAYNGFPQAEYYPYGLRDIWYMCFTKVKRLESQIIRDGESNFEGIEDSARDLINYAAFLVEFAEGKMDGQKSDED